MLVSLQRNLIIKKMEKITKKYTNGEVTIIWKPDLCIHAAICFRQLPDVFKPGERPWIDPNAATTEELINTIKKCPTKALQYEMNEKLDGKSANNEAPIIITVMNDGPFIIEGAYKIQDEKGNEIILKDNNSLCRCGASKTQPFCDGAHEDIKFKDNS